MSLRERLKIRDPAVYPKLSNKMAMRIGKEYGPDKIFFRHWCHLIPNTATAKKGLIKELQAISYSCVEKSLELKRTFKEEGVKSQIFTGRVIEV